MIQPMVFLREDKSPWIYSSTTILIANSKHPSIDSKMQETTNRYHLALYEAAREPVRADKGSPYPCTQRDIDLVVNGLAENPNFQYNTPSFVTNRLVQWLSQDPSPSVTVALQRLRACTTPDRWGPDLAIKAFKDLDLAFFNGTLLGHCMVKWYGRSAWMELLAERGVSHRALVATTLRTRPAECIIQLNAEEHLLHKGLTPQPWKTVWETLLHEMVVSRKVSWVLA